MDLKRAWRNGFLVSVIFAIPLSDLYNNQFSSLIAENNSKVARVEHAGTCGTDTLCTSSADGDSGIISGVPSAWDNDADEKGPSIPGNVLADLLPETGNGTASDIQQAAVQFDPQDIFLSERNTKIDLGSFGSDRQNSYASFGQPYAPGFSGPFSPAMFAAGGGKTSAGLRNATSENSETPFVDPLDDSNAVASDTTTSGIGDESLHNVPEPSSFVLITIGTISVATLLYRKPKTQTPLS